MYRRMVESAAAQGRLNDARLVCSLARCLTNVIIAALEAGCRDLAGDAIKICRMLPIEPSRRLRLAIYQIFNSLPSGTFPRFWPFWLKFRHAAFENPNRKIARLRNVWKMANRSA